MTLHRLTVPVLLRSLAVLAAVLVLAVAHPAAAQDRRVAVVVGNSAYDFAPLTNPRNDARLIGKTLTELGFDVLLLLDVQRSQGADLLDTVKRHLSGADMAIFYYAGHAIQHEGRNLLLPVDVRTASVGEVVDDSVTLDALIATVKDDSSGMKLFILDACRNNPVADGKDLKSGLAYVEAGSGEVLIAFATSSGQVAYDGNGANSPYTSALANALMTPGLDVYDTFRTVRGTVRQATEGAQIPWITGSLEQRFVFRQGEGAEPPADVAQATAMSLDEILWTFIRNSADPVDFERFVEVFPDSRYAEEARALSRRQLAALQERKVTIAGSLASASISATDAPSLPEDDADILFRQGSQYAVSELFRIWPRRAPAEGRFASTITDCDLLAADPVDPQKLVPGTTNGLVNIRDAVRACALDLARDSENPRLQFQLGRVLEIAKYYAWAEVFYTRAAEQDYSAAITNLGFMYRAGVGRPVDHAKAVALYSRAADLGNLRARTNLGTAFMRGQGVPKLPEEGILWYRLAASGGWPNAVNALANAYLKGDGVAKDPPLAARLYTEAVAGGQIDAMSSLGVLYVSGTGVEKDVPKGLETLLEATRLGNRFAPLHAARVLLKGDKGVEKDPRRAEELMQRAAERGFVNAYGDLAKAYRDGAFGGGKSPERAYYYAVLAERTKAPDGADLRAALAGDLPDAERERIEESADVFLRQNGD